MPELPEVETVCEAIKENIKSRDILKFNIFNSSLRWKIDKKINNNISNNHIDKISDPLALYLFTSSKKFIHKIKNQVKSLKNKQNKEIKNPAGLARRAADWSYYKTGFWI